MAAAAEKENTCPQCRVEFNSTNSRKVTDDCGHVKCRTCLAQSIDGCELCKTQGEPKKKGPFQNHNHVHTRIQNGPTSGSSSTTTVVVQSTPPMTSRTARLSANRSVASNSSGRSSTILVRLASSHNSSSSSSNPNLHQLGTGYRGKSVPGLPVTRAQLKEMPGLAPVTGTNSNSNCSSTNSVDSPNSPPTLLSEGGTPPKVGGKRRSATRDSPNDKEISPEKISKSGGGSPDITQGVPRESPSRSSRSSSSPVAKGRSTTTSLPSPPSKLSQLITRSSKRQEVLELTHSRSSSSPPPTAAAAISNSEEEAVIKTKEGSNSMPPQPPEKEGDRDNDEDDDDGEDPKDPDNAEGEGDDADLDTDADAPSTSKGGGDGKGGQKNKKKRNPLVIPDHITVLEGDPPMYQCNVCQKKFKTKAHIKYHEFCQKGDKPFKCEQCGQGFIAKNHYEYHLRTHTGEKPYLCPKCGKGFNQQGKVTRHMRSHTGEKPFICQECNRGFANAQALRSHILIHTGERPFACTYCNKRFTGMTNLKKHIITHTGERPFTCNHCGKSFGLKWTLDLHLRTHSSERPYACDQCSQAFSNNKDLRRHLIIHTGERPFKCWICGTAFRRKDNLDRHIKKTHNQPKEVAKQLANEAAAEYLKNNAKSQQQLQNIPTSKVNSAVIANIIKKNGFLQRGLKLGSSSSNSSKKDHQTPSTSAAAIAKDAAAKKTTKRKRNASAKDKDTSSKKKKPVPSTTSGSALFEQSSLRNIQKVVSPQVQSKKGASSSPSDPIDSTPVENVEVVTPEVVVEKEKKTKKKGRKEPTLFLNEDRRPTLALVTVSSPKQVEREEEDEEEVESILPHDIDEEEMESVVENEEDETVPQFPSNDEEDDTNVVEVTLPLVGDAEQEGDSTRMVLFTLDPEEFQLDTIVEGDEEVLLNHPDAVPVAVVAPEPEFYSASSSTDNDAALTAEQEAILAASVAAEQEEMLVTTKTVQVEEKEEEDNAAIDTANDLSAPQQKPLSPSCSVMIPDDAVSTEKAEDVADTYVVDDAEPIHTSSANDLSDNQVENGSSNLSGTALEIEGVEKQAIQDLVEPLDDEVEEQTEAVVAEQAEVLVEREPNYPAPSSPSRTPSELGLSFDEPASPSPPTTEIDEQQQQLVTTELLNQEEMEEVNDEFNFDEVPSSPVAPGLEEVEQKVSIDDAIEAELPASSNNTIQSPEAIQRLVEPKEGEFVEDEQETAATVISDAVPPPPTPPSPPKVEENSMVERVKDHATSLSPCPISDDDFCFEEEEDEREQRVIQVENQVEQEQQNHLEQLTDDINNVDSVKQHVDENLDLDTKVDTEKTSVELPPSPPVAAFPVENGCSSLSSNSFPEVKTEPTSMPSSPSHEQNDALLETDTQLEGAVRETVDEPENEEECDREIERIFKADQFETAPEDESLSMETTNESHSILNKACGSSLAEMELDNGTLPPSPPTLSEDSLHVPEDVDPVHMMELSGDYQDNMLIDDENQMEMPSSPQGDQESSEPTCLNQNDGIWWSSYKCPKCQVGFFSNQDRNFHINKCEAYDMDSESDEDSMDREADAEQQVKRNLSGQQNNTAEQMEQDLDERPLTLTSDGDDVQLDGGSPIDEVDHFNHEVNDEQMNKMEKQACSISKSLSMERMNHQEETEGDHHDEQLVGDETGAAVAVSSSSSSPTTEDKEEEMMISDAVPPEKAEEDVTDACVVDDAEPIIPTSSASILSDNQVENDGSNLIGAASEIEDAEKDAIQNLAKQMVDEQMEEPLDEQVEAPVVEGEPNHPAPSSPSPTPSELGLSFYEEENEDLSKFERQHYHSATKPGEDLAQDSDDEE